MSVKDEQPPRAQGVLRGKTNKEPDVSDVSDDSGCGGKRFRRVPWRSRCIPTLGGDMGKKLAECTKEVDPQNPNTKKIGCCNPKLD